MQTTKVQCRIYQSASNYVYIYLPRNFLLHIHYRIYTCNFHPCSHRFLRFDKDCCRIHLYLWRKREGRNFNKGHLPFYSQNSLTLVAEISTPPSSARTAESPVLIDARATVFTRAVQTFIEILSEENLIFSGFI